MIALVLVGLAYFSNIEGATSHTCHTLALVPHFLHVVLLRRTVHFSF